MFGNKGYLSQVLFNLRLINGLKRIGRIISQLDLIREIEK
ncbi:MAG: hypothetical protein ANABAC_1257 [Anaerolineae bacterium]|nr:MAG: hypothetical protein ANABAC_1257 [Anaerolineae bacterium]